MMLGKPYNKESNPPGRISFKVDDVDWELSKEATVKVRQYGMTLSQARAVIWKRGVAEVLGDGPE